MFTVTPNKDILGATITGFDARQPMSEEVFGRLLNTLGRYGVLRFPNQELDAPGLKAFSERFGDIQSGIHARLCQRDAALRLGFSSGCSQ